MTYQVWIFETGYYYPNDGSDEIESAHETEYDALAAASRWRAENGGEHSWNEAVSYRSGGCTWAQDGYRLAWVYPVNVQPESPYSKANWVPPEPCPPPTSRVEEDCG